MEDTHANNSEPHAAGPAGEKAETDTNLAAKLEEAEQTIAGLKDRLLRDHSDLQNQRQRMERELNQARQFANERLLKDLLTVCDNLENGLAAETDNIDKLREGMRLTLKSLDKVVSDHGLEIVDPVNEAFDPQFHQAMTTVPTADHAPDTVVQVVQKGYVLHGRLLRPAMVIVAKEP